MESRSVDESDNMIQIHGNIGEVILEKCTIHFDVDNSAYAYLKRGITIDSFLNFAKQIAQMMLNCMEQGVHLETDLKKIRMEGDVAIFSVHFGESNSDYYSTATYLKNLAGMATFVGSDFLMYVYDYMSFIDNNQDPSIEVLIDKIESLMNGEIGNTGIPKPVISNRTQNNSHSYSGTLKSEEIHTGNTYTDNLHSGKLNSGSMNSGNLSSGNLYSASTYRDSYETTYDSYEEEEEDEFAVIGEGSETGVLDPNFWAKYQEQTSTSESTRESSRLHKNQKAIVLHSMVNGKRYQANKDVILVGKDQNTVDVFIPKDTVSRNHAQIENKSGKFYLRDLDSTNGTFVNGRKVASGAPVELFNGDEVKFSDEVMKFMII